MEDHAPFLLQTGESLQHQVCTGDKVNLRNETPDVMVISVKGQVSGTVIRVHLPPEGEIEVTAGLEGIDISLGDGKQEAPEAVAH